MSLPMNQYFPDNRPRHLTSEALRSGIVNFRPRNMAEAEALQKELLRQGFIWMTGEDHVQRLEACVARGVHLDRGRIVTGNDRRGKYIDATLADLTAPAPKPKSVPPAPEKTEIPRPLTADFFTGKRVVFTPKTVEEAAFIQEVLFSFGMGWNEHGKNVSNLDQCVAEKMVVRDGKVFYKPSLRKENIYADIADLPGYDPNDLRSPQEKLQARVGVLEAEVAALKAALAELTQPATPARILKSPGATTIARKAPLV